MATATSRPPARDIRDTVNPPRGFDQSAMLTSYRVWDQSENIIIRRSEDINQSMKRERKMHFKSHPDHTGTNGRNSASYIMMASEIETISEMGHKIIKSNTTT